MKAAATLIAVFFAHLLVAEATPDPNAHVGTPSTAPVKDWTFEAHRNQAKSFASAVGALAKMANDAQVREEMSQRMKEIEGAIKKDLAAHPHTGALVRVDVFVNENGVKVVRGLPYLGVGSSPDAALEASRNEPAYVAPAPGGLLFDQNSSGYLWIELAPAGLQSYSITGPAASAMERAVDAKLGTMLGVSGNKPIVTYSPASRTTAQAQQQLERVRQERQRHDDERRAAQQAAVSAHEGTEKALGSGKSLSEHEHEGHEPHFGGGGGARGGDGPSKDPGPNPGGDKPHEHHDTQEPHFETHVEGRPG